MKSNADGRHLHRNSPEWWAAIERAKADVARLIERDRNIVNKDHTLFGLAGLVLFARLDRFRL